MKKINWKFILITILMIIIIIVGIKVSDTGKLGASLISSKQTITLQTNQGDIVIELFEKEAPNLSDNFYWLAKSGKYNNTIFHRVIDGFMIQGGDFENSDGTGGTGFKQKYVLDEFSESLSHTRGMVSMANKGPDTNGSQFFIVQQDAEFLDVRHSIFGKVVSGMEIVDKIASVTTDLNDKPKRDIVIKRALPKK